jgi:hypothetical protein
MQSITTGYPSGYTDTYMVDVAAAVPGSTGTVAGGTTTTETTPPPTTTTPTATTVTRTEQTAAAVTYVGTWYNNSMTVHSGSSAKLAVQTGARATFSFNGTGASWIAYRDQWSGIANVYVDGVLKSEIDTYASPAGGQSKVYSITGLSSGDHTLAVEVTGRRNASSGGAWIWVDAFETISGGTSTTTTNTSTTNTSTTNTTNTTTSTTQTGTSYRVDQTDARVRFAGTWSNNTMSVHNGGSAKLSMEAGADVRFTFTGTSVTWVAYRDQWSGIAKIYVDGVLKAEVDTYAATAAAKSAMYAISGLPWGTHTITVQVAGRRSSSSKGNWIWVDAFDYVGAQ